MTRAIKNFGTFVWRCARLALDGDGRYYLWIGSLFVPVLQCGKGAHPKG